MKATEELMAEHSSVLVALQILEKVEAALLAGKLEATGHLGQLVDFFKGFVDNCHHAKEEQALFPEMERRGVPRDGGPIGVMLMEHEVGRGHVRAMSSGQGRLQRAEAGAAAAAGEAARLYRDLLRAHIAKENNVLFPMAGRILPADAAAKVADEFEGIERDRVGEGKHEAYHAMLQALKDAYGIA
jgi:hemerythrin-like domain-containing protein